MKVALLLTGFVRTYLQTFPNLKEKILDSHDVDVYICSWDKSQLRSLEQYSEINKTDILETYKNWLVDAKFLSHDGYEIVKPSPIQFIDRENDVFKVNERAIAHGSYWVERLRDQWFIVQQAFNMISDYEKYDIIMRLRFDIDLHNIKLLNKDFVIPSDIGGWSYSDHFAYGNYETMKKYCSMYDHLEKMYIEHNVDITHAVDMLEFYMEQYQNKVNTFIDPSIQYTIIK